MNNQLPQGFFFALTASGETALGFNCTRCCHYYLPSPKAVRHCGKLEILDPHAKLTEIKLTYGRDPMSAARVIEV